jgi:uncharacterized protein YndB with AHSA1/START domain
VTKVTEDCIQKEVRVAASVEQVWAVLTERKYMEEWFSRGATKVRELDLRPGGLLLLDHGATTLARIVTIDPPHVFSYQWAMAYPGAEPTEENSTLVEFRLTSDGDATVLRVTESGYAKLSIPAGQEECAGLEAHSQGWPVYLEEIRVRAEEFAVK